MQQDKILELKEGLTTAFIDQTFYSNLAYKPQFIYNDNKNGQKVFSSIEDELKNCDQFAISVAFITRGGITPLLQTLKELEQRKIPGRILTTDYLCFSDPVALDKIASLSNITLRMYQTERAGNGFHTKGYIFQKGEEYRFIIGSSNLTQDALTRNIEWNTKMVSASQGEMINSVRREFEQLWSDKNCVKDYEAFIEEYRNRYAQKQLLEKLIADQKKIAKRETIPSIEAYTLQPNSMQQAFIYNLLKLRNKKVDKALLISATGTGKTYAAAFAMRELGFHRVLFLVHRNQIARQAKTSFERVFGSRLNTGLISGKSKDYDADYIFATVRMEFSFTSYFLTTVHTFYGTVYTFMLYSFLDLCCVMMEMQEMDERNFRLWMEKEKNYHTARTYTSRCIRVESEMGINLDEQFEKNQGSELMQKLKYSRKESREGLQPQCGITFDVDVDVYSGMHSLRASVKKYFEYLRLIQMAQVEKNRE